MSSILTGYSSFIFHCRHTLGQRLCLVDNEHVSGNGTYEHQGYIHSSLAGIVKISEKTENNVKVSGSC